MNKTGWIIFSVVVAAVLAGLVVWTRIANPPVDVSGIDNGTLVAASANNGNIADHVTGKKDSKVLLIEYGDFQCPSCGSAYPQTKQIIKEYGDRVGFVFRNFPLTSLHPNARVAAATAEAAGLQGKYWEMHDMLYEKQDDWSGLSGDKRGDIFNSYAQTLGLDMDKFKADLQSNSTSGDTSTTKKIAFDQALGKKFNVNATPTFFINGKQMDDATREAFVKGQDISSVRAALDEALKNAK